MRVTTSMIQRNVLADLNTLSEKIAKTQAKASSQKEISRPSDDPFNAARAMGLRQTLDANNQYKRNIDDAQGWQDATESSLSAMTDYVTRANTLVLQGATDTADAESRLAIAAEIDQIIQGLKETANATYGDSYLMAGTATNVPPYKLGNDDTFQGNEAGLDPAIPGVVREIGPGVNVQVNVSGEDVLGDGTTGLLATLRGIVTDLNADNGPALRARVAELDQGLDNLNAVRAKVGATTNRLESADSRLQEFEGTTLGILSENEDVDMGKAMIDFSIQQAALQAGLQAGSRIVQNSLLDFLR